MTVRCSQCGQDNRDEAQFCTHCQAPLTREKLLSDASTAVDRKLRFPVGSILLGLICVVYLLNPTAGILELIPDNIPIAGNLDEGLATAGMIMALNNMGVLNWFASLGKKDVDS